MRSEPDTVVAFDRRPIEVLVVDAQSLFRDAVRRVLDDEPDIRVVATAATISRALSEAQRTMPDVALVSVELTDGDGVRAASMITHRVPGCRVLALGNFEDHETLVDAMGAGASGYLTKESPVTELIEAIRAVHRDGILVPARLLPPLISGLLDRRREHDRAAAQIAKLTRRQRAVLRLLAEGADNDAIGRALVISPQTARTHVQNILTKLGLHSRLAAAAVARASGIREGLERLELVES